MSGYYAVSVHLIFRPLQVPKHKVTFLQLEMLSFQSLQSDKGRNSASIFSDKLSFQQVADSLFAHFYINVALKNQAWSPHLYQRFYVLG